MACTCVQFAGRRSVDRAGIPLWRRPRMSRELAVSCFYLSYERRAGVSGRVTWSLADIIKAWEGETISI